MTRKYPFQHLTSPIQHLTSHPHPNYTQTLPLWEGNTLSNRLPSHPQLYCKGAPVYDGCGTPCWWCTSWARTAKVVSSVALWHGQYLSALGVLRLYALQIDILLATYLSTWSHNPDFSGRLASMSVKIVFLKCPKHHLVCVPLNVIPDRLVSQLQQLQKVLSHSLACVLVLAGRMLHSLGIRYLLFRARSDFQ